MSPSRPAPSLPIDRAFGAGSNASGAASAAASTGPAAKRVTLEGTYEDSVGSSQHWRISPAHTLYWNGAPWIPVGVVFTPRSLQNDDPSALEADRQALASLSASGIRDLLVHVDLPADSVAAGATTHTGSADQSRLQSLLDSLNQTGFRFGLDLSDLSGASTPEAGESETVTGQHGARSPGEFGFGEVYLKGAPLAAGVFAAAAPPDLTQALGVVRGKAGNVVQMGLIEARNGTLLVQAGSDATSAYFVPVRSSRDSHSMMGNPATRASGLWDSFPVIRDRVLFTLRGLKFGPGLRFFLNPVNSDFAPSGRSAYTFPRSHGFRSLFAAWIERHFGRPEALVERWGAAPGAIKQFEQAARLIPDSSSPDALWDPENNSVITIAGGAQFWMDFESFRRETNRHDMDLLAGSLRQNIADLPVVYDWQRFDPVYAGAGSPVTFDGLAVRPEDSTPRADRQAAYAFAQVADAPWDRWIGLFGGASPSLGNLETCVSLGLKAYFLTPENDSNPLSGETRRAIDYIREATAGDHSARRLRLTSAVEPGAPSDVAGDFAGFTPGIVWFPWDLQIASVQRLADGTWWLPTTRPGSELALGPELEGYQMKNDPGRLVLWSAVGPRTFHFKLPVTARVTGPAQGEMKEGGHGTRAITLTAAPTTLEGVASTDLFPMDTLEKVFHQADELKHSMLIPRDAREQLQITAATAKKMVGSGELYDAYLLLAYPLGIQRRAALPYIWLEGEKALSQTLSGTARSRDCSEGAYLWLNTPDPPPAGKSYEAMWTFEASATGDYDLWMGGTPPGQDWSSPVEWTLDGKPLKVDHHGPAGARYGPGFHWAQLGSFFVMAGKHTLAATVIGPRIEPDDAYALAIDALAFSPTDELVRSLLAPTLKARSHR